jgi:hypothetical protein
VFFFYLRLGLIVLVVALVTFAWVYFLRNEIRQWWIERKPRQRLKREMAEERQREMARLRDELASKYLPPGTDGAAKP